MMACPAGVLARHPRMALPSLARGCGLVPALRLQAVRIPLRRLRLLVVIGVDLLLGPGLYQERGENSNCQHESE